MAYRTIDARGIWQGETKALDGFIGAWGIDCNGNDDTFRRVYGWTDEAMQAAKERAMGPSGPSLADTLEA